MNQYNNLENNGLKTYIVPTFFIDNNHFYNKFEIELFVSCLVFKKEQKKKTENHSLCPIFKPSWAPEGTM